jgi:hypothetical protein
MAAKGIAPEQVARMTLYQIRCVLTDRKELLGQGPTDDTPDRMIRAAAIMDDPKLKARLLGVRWDGTQIW